MPRDFAILEFSGFSRLSRRLATTHDDHKDTLQEVTVAENVNHAAELARRKRDWLRNMFLFGTAGSIANLLWPYLVYVFKAASVGDPINIGSPVQIVIFLVAAVLIALLAVAFSFATFLSDETKRNTLRGLGTLSYFSAFTWGLAHARS